MDFGHLLDMAVGSSHPFVVGTTIELFLRVAGCTTTDTFLRVIGHDTFRMFA
jgi:hypothetical protein